MSKAIVVMEAPKRCKDCPLFNQVTSVRKPGKMFADRKSYCKFICQLIDDPGKIQEWCPLTIVPDDDYEIERLKRMQKEHSK